MSIAKVLLQEEKTLMRYVSADDIEKVVESLGRIEDEVLKRIAMLEAQIPKKMDPTNKRGWHVDYRPPSYRVFIGVGSQNTECGRRYFTSCRDDGEAIRLAIAEAKRKGCFGEAQSVKWLEEKGYRVEDFITNNKKEMHYENR